MTRAAFIVLAFSLAASSAHAEPREVVTVSGPPLAAELAAIDAQWQISLRTADGERKLAATDLVAWGHMLEPGSRSTLLLTDGSLIVADVLAVDGETLTADSYLVTAAGQPLALPRAEVAGIVFQPPGERRARDLLFGRILAAADDTDRLILTNGDELTGLLRTVQEAACAFETDLGPLNVETHRIRALLLSAATRRKIEHPGLSAIVALADGSRIAADQLVARGEICALTSAGREWTVAQREVVGLQMRGGHFTWLSDLPGGGYRHVPFLEQSWPLSLDRNASGGMLRAGDRLWLKGLGMHSASRATYMVDGRFGRFEAELAIDDETDGGGSVRFRVYVDGQAKYTSPIVRGGQPPLPLSVDIAGAKRLDLVVDFADRADELDRANRLRARVIP